MMKDQQQYEQQVKGKKWLSSNTEHTFFSIKKKKENGEFQESNSFAISHEGNNLSEVLDHPCDFL